VNGVSLIGDKVDSVVVGGTGVVDGVSVIGDEVESVVVDGVSVTGDEVDSVVVGGTGVVDGVSVIGDEVDSVVGGGASVVDGVSLIGDEVDSVVVGGAGVVDCVSVTGDEVDSVVVGDVAVSVVGDASPQDTMQLNPVPSPPLLVENSMVRKSSSAVSSEKVASSILPQITSSSLMLLSVSLSPRHLFPFPLISMLSQYIVGKHPST